MLTIKNVSTDPFYNLALEEYVFQNFTEDDIFFLWQNRPTVIVGSYQNICREVNVGSLMKMKIPVLRRISGGGTVYHDAGNVNYTYITRQDGLVDYDDSVLPVVRALNAIGVPARKNRTCDIAIGEQKISGSAQRKVKNRLLHHGTLLFSSDLDVLDAITTQNKNDGFRTKGTCSAICPVTNIQEHLKEPMKLQEFKERLLAQFLPGDCCSIALTEEQQAEICRLRDEKYHSWAWTWGRTPAFTYEKTGIFRQVPITVSYQAKKGIISDAHIACKEIDGQKAAEMLAQSRMDPKEMMEICRVLCGFEAEELFQVLL